MQTAKRIRRRWQGVCLLGLVFWVGCGTVASLTKDRYPDLEPVTASYFPGLIKDRLPKFPAFRVLVLLPIDKRQAYPLQTTSLPPLQDNTALLGISGLNSQEGVVRISPSPENYPQIPHTLGAQRRMKAGIPQPPDIPHSIFTLANLPRLVQDALESHLADAGFSPQKVNFSALDLHTLDTRATQYALSCTIERFSLISLERIREVPVFRPLSGYALINMPARGPTRADVGLALTLSRLPTGEVLWDGKVTSSVDDPPLEENEFLYPSSGEVLSMALSQAVGSLLGDQELQTVLVNQQAER